MRKYFETLREARKACAEWNKEHTLGMDHKQVFLAFKVWPNRKKRRYFVGTDMDWNFEKFS
jgi:hypothetical protein